MPLDPYYASKGALVSKFGLDERTIEDYVELGESE